METVGGSPVAEVDEAELPCFSFLPSLLLTGEIWLSGSVSERSRSETPVYSRAAHRGTVAGTAASVECDAG